MTNQIALPRGQTTADLLADALRQWILQGQFAEGQELTQETIAAEFGVSRVPLREAMRRLEGEGLIIFHANRGAFVAKLSARDIREIYELRMLLEGDLIFRAVPKMTSADLRKAGRIHQALEMEEDPNEQDVLNRAFHSTLYRCAERAKQQAIIDNLRNLVERYENLNRALVARTANFQNDHRRILTACRRGASSEARKRVIQHLQNAMKIALHHIGR